MAYCANCGNQLTEGQKFCPACGHAAAASGPADATGPGAQAAEGASPASTPVKYAPPPEAVPYQQGWSYYPQAEQPPSPPRRSHRGMWIGVGAAVVVIAIACGVVFGLSGGDTSGTGGETSGTGVDTSGAGGGTASAPEETVRQLMAALESKDVDAVFDLLDPQSMSMLLDGQPETMVKQMLKAVLFGQKSITISDMELRTEQTNDTTATVMIIAGKVTVSHASGEKETYDVSELSESPGIGMVKRGGSWLIDAASVVALVARAGEVGGDGADEAVTTTSTSTTLFTPSTSAGAGSGGAPTPEEVVLRFFRAMEQKDVAAVFALFDPEALQELTGGMPVETFLGLMGESLFEGLLDYQSIEFNDVELKVDYASDSSALVTVVAGSVTLTDSDGQTKTEDVTESMGPAEINVVKRGSAWYMDPGAMF